MTGGRVLIAATFFLASMVTGCGGGGGSRESSSASSLPVNTATTSEQEPPTTKAEPPAAPPVLPDAADVLLQPSDLPEDGWETIPNVPASNPDDVCDATSAPSNFSSPLDYAETAMQISESGPFLFQAVAMYEDAASAEATYDEAVERMDTCENYSTTLPTGEPAQWTVFAIPEADFGPGTSTWAGAFGPESVYLEGTWVYAQRGQTVISLSVAGIGDFGDSVLPPEARAYFKAAEAKAEPLTR